MDVKVIKTEGKAVVVEAVLQGKVERRIVPEGRVSDGVISEQDFESGIDYGLPFDEFICAIDITGQLQVALHNADIWTLEDLYSKGRQAIGALQAVYGVELARIIQAAEKYLKEKPASKPVSPQKVKTKKETNYE